MAGMRLKGRSSAPADGPVFQPVRGLDTPMGSGHVRRHIPRSARRRVGPWCFLDRFGPTEVPADAQGGGVGPHPHTGLATVTWLLSGEMVHHDSVGSLQRIQPGEVNWMTAGRGISHAELGAPGPQVVDGVQLWVALPPEDAALPPSFEHFKDLPRRVEGGCELVVFAGEVGALRAPVVPRSPLVGAEIRLPAGGGITLPLDPGFEHSVLLLRGEAQAEAQPLGRDAMVYLGTGRTSLELHSAAGGRVMLLGGQPMPGELVMWWNFVAWEPEDIAEAAADWAARAPRFGEIEGVDLPRIPAPPLG
jgi:quercetin 2,3-dioxygenase